MPTPLEILLDPVSLYALTIYGVLMLWEAVFPGRELPPVKGWKLRGLTVFFVYFYVSSYLPLIVAPYLEPYRLFDFSGWGTLAGGIFGVMLYEFGVFVWHYSLHHNGFLWRTFHQMHHSAERLDTYGAFYFSPLDIIGFTMVSTVCFSLIAGLSPQAITFTLLTTMFLGVFQHANIRTPRWLGYIVQRPESHTVHHATEIHNSNYSDLPIFDILFGTFHNPKEFEHKTGFYHGASSRIGDMLLGRDVTTPRDGNELETIKVNDHELQTKDI